jgi:hypothetical protein
MEKNDLASLLIADSAGKCDTHIIGNLFFVPVMAITRGWRGEKREHRFVILSGRLDRYLF